MRFLLDMNLTKRWASYLIDAGHECYHWSDIGQPNAPDHVICGHARENGFVLITNDLDFPCSWPTVPIRSRASFCYVVNRSFRNSVAARCCVRSRTLEAN